MRICLYCRVSSDKQELDQQIAACKRFCDYRGFEVAAVYSEIVSGAKAKRPQYLQMIKDLRAYKYDGVVVFRLDRLGRNARELALLVDELENKGIKVFSVNESFDTSTAIGRAMRELIYIFAQLEREQIGEATKQRLAAVKAQGKKLGRKPASAYQVKRVRELRAKGQSLRQIARGSMLSYGTVYNIVNQKGCYADSLRSQLG
ncbi:recombinase family protein [Candidatus Acetothermia bacterium]|nr:recombinase family protein [Candidatus Acetothermia bacterium]